MVVGTFLGTESSSRFIFPLDGRFFFFRRSLLPRLTPRRMRKRPELSVRRRSQRSANQSIKIMNVLKATFLGGKYVGSTQPKSKIMDELNLRMSLVVGHDDVV